MLDLALKALASLDKKADEHQPSSSNPFKVAAKEAFEAAKAGDFERYFTAFESAMDIRLAEMGPSHRDVPDDVEPYELSELDKQ